MKTKAYLLAGAVAIATALPASAQIRPMHQTTFKAERLLPGQKSTTPQIDVSKEYPLLKGRLYENTVSPFFKQHVTVLRKNKVAAPLMINQNLTIWGNLLSDNLTGIYSFNPTPTIQFTELAAYNRGLFNGGCGIVDDQLHGIYYDTSMASSGVIKVYHYAFDIDTWDMVIPRTPIENNISIIALETAYDPTTGKTFGEFYTSDFKSMEWGEVDYKTLTRTTIAPAQHTYVALGITSDGRVFGVDDNGDLYQIDRTTGSETLKGSTGVQVKSSDGTFYFQSGEIDPQTNEFYWAAKDARGNSNLYTVDLNDAHLTEVASLDYTNVIGMTIPRAKAADDAPAAVKDVTINFRNESRMGTVAFKAPDKTYGGAALTGNLKYSITANGEEIAKDKPTAPGARINAMAYVNKEGMYVFTISTSNDHGQSPRLKIKKYIGHDTPKPATDVTLKINAATRRATVSWTAPTEGIHGGYIGQLKYDVYRIKNSDTTRVATATPLTNFSETLPQSSQSSYTYAVCAVNSTQKSEWASSENKVFGNALEPPFFDNFENEGTTKIFTIIDGNEDNSTWEWGADPEKTKAFFYRYSGNTADDWLVTPAFKLKGGKTYNIAFKAASSTPYYNERLEVKWGTAATVAGMTEVLLPATDLTTGNYEEFEKQITPATDGEYHIGFHAISEADKYFLFIDELSVEASVEQAAPAAVTELKATADPTGALKSTITFKAPDKTTDGSALTAISKIEIKSGDRLVKEITSPAPGSEQSVTDDNASAGLNTYIVAAYNSQGRGVREKTTVFVGIDTPKAPAPSATDNTTSVKLKWNAVAGVNGGVITPDAVEFNIFNVTERNELGEKIVTLPGTTTEYDITGLNNNEGNQTYARWAMNATTSAGASDYAVTSLIVGAPYDLPYHNSFKDGGLEGKFIAIESPTKGVSWAIDRAVSVDNDGGALSFGPEAEGTASIIPGKINLRGTANPKLIFDYKGTAAAPGKLEILVRHKDGTLDPAIWTHDFSSEPNAGQWNNVIVNLPASLSGEDYALVYFRATAAGNLRETPIYVDNINIADPPRKDAEIELTAPERLTKGQTAGLKLKVTNRGFDKLENAKIKLSVNNNIVHEATISQAISFTQSVEIPVNYRTTTLNNATTLNLRAEVTADGDAQTDNNVATATIHLEKATVAAPTELKSNSQHASGVELTWKAPASAPETVTDDFESYDAWGLDFEKWTTVDEDHGKAGSLIQQGTYPHQGEKFAFMNWRPGDYFKAGLGLDPHSGEKAAVAIYQAETQSFVDANNWLISPLLSGNEQTIRFWVNNVKGKDYGTETFEVLASSTGTNTADFQKIGDTHTQSTGQWTEVSVKLPQGTRYFAIHHITSGNQAYIFMVDDATFETSNGAVSFNIYRDNEYLGNTAGESFIDNSPDAGTKNHSYSVTAVYFDNIESDPVTISVASFIDALQIDGQTSYTVYTLDGKLVLQGARNLKSLPKGVYIINGKKTNVLK